MQNTSLRVAAIHDLSGFGRCALSVILPVLSVMGIQVCPIPTAVLSTHTGGLGEVALRDLSDFLQPALAHYQRLSLHFNSIYTGFLSSAGQVDDCLAYFRAFPSALAVVDPVMGDHGKPYRTCTPNLCRRMGELARAADLITPNLTEACILLGTKYITDETLHTDKAKELLQKLGALGPRYVVLTGVPLQNGMLSNLGYDRETNAYWRFDAVKLPVSYPGTGDLFTSVLLGRFLKDQNLPAAIEDAGRFVGQVIQDTFAQSTDPRYGVLLEANLYRLFEK